MCRTYFEVHATFDARAGQYAGRWFDEKFRKGDDEHARAERIFDTPEAKASASARRPSYSSPRQAGRCRGSKTTDHAAPPLLYDLTSLQRGPTAASASRHARRSAGAGALRKAQGADLPTDRRTARCRKTMSARSGRRCSNWKKPTATASSPVKSATKKYVRTRQQARLRQRKISDHRDHSDAATAKGVERAGRKALRHGRQALPCVCSSVTSSSKLPALRASKAKRSREGKVLVNPAGLRCTAKPTPRKPAT